MINCFLVVWFTYLKGNKLVYL